MTQQNFLNQHHQSIEPLVTLTQDRRNVQSVKGDGQCIGVSVLYDLIGRKKVSGKDIENRLRDFVNNPGLLSQFAPNSDQQTKVRQAVGGLQTALNGDGSLTKEDFHKNTNNSTNKATKIIDALYNLYFAIYPEDTENPRSTPSVNHVVNFLSQALNTRINILGNTAGNTYNLSYFAERKHGTLHQLPYNNTTPIWDATIASMGWPKDHVTLPYSQEWKKTLKNRSKVYIGGQFQQSPQTDKQKEKFLNVLQQLGGDNKFRSINIMQFFKKAEHYGSVTNPSVVKRDGSSVFTNEEKVFSVAFQKACCAKRLYLSDGRNGNVYNNVYENKSGMRSKSALTFAETYGISKTDIEQAFKGITR